MIKLKVALAAAIIAASVFSGTGRSIAHEGVIAHEGAAVVQIVSGTASWYGPGFNGRLTANGERYNMDGLTAAHRTLPFGTEVRVTNRHNGKSVVVRINDRGPFHGNRVIDLSRKAATSIGMVGSGVAPVKIEVLETTT